MLTQEMLVPVEETLLAGDYRRLWLNDAHALGQIAETLADALGCGGPLGASEDEPLPDPLALAGVAADRIAMLEAMLTVTHGLVAPQNISSMLLHFCLN